MIVSALIGRTGSDILLDVGFVGSVLVTGYGMVKVAYARRMGKPLDTPVTRWLDIGVDVFANAIGALNKYRVARGQDPLLPHPGVVAAEARAEAAESQVADAEERAAARTTTLVPPVVLRTPTLPGVTPPPSE